jgi:hypothetical protein
MTELPDAEPKLDEPRQLKEIPNTVGVQELIRARNATPLAARLDTLARKAKTMAGHGAREMTKDEIDALSGQ